MEVPAPHVPSMTHNLGVTLSALGNGGSSGSSLCSSDSPQEGDRGLRFQPGEGGGPGTPSALAGVGGCGATAFLQSMARVEVLSLSCLSHLGDRLPFPLLLW